MCSLTIECVLFLQSVSVTNLKDKEEEGGRPTSTGIPKGKEGEERDREERRGERGGEERAREDCRRGRAGRKKEEEEEEEEGEERLFKARSAVEELAYVVQGAKSSLVREQSPRVRGPHARAEGGGGLTVADLPDACSLPPACTDAAVPCSAKHPAWYGMVLARRPLRTGQSVWHVCCNGIFFFFLEFFFLHVILKNVFCVVNRSEWRMCSV